MPNGSLVTKFHAQSIEVICETTAGDVIGMKITPVPGIKTVSGITLMNYFHDYGDLIYTTPDLEARGLGYVVLGGTETRVSSRIDCLNGDIYPINFHGNTDNSFPPALTEQPFPWQEVPNVCSESPQKLRLVISGIIVLVKIGNSSQHAVLPQNFTAPLFSYSVYNQNAPTTPAASLTVSWSITNFSSRVITRTCTTPTASESVIYLGTFGQQQIQQMAPGTTTAQREFTLTFTCPPAGYQNISFFVEPMHGEIAGYGEGVMGIAQGNGMAKGVGVYLEEYGMRQANTWQPVIYRTDSSPIAVFAGKYWLYSNYAFSYHNIDPLTDPPQQQVVQFRASLIRLNEPVVAGQVKAAALIHIRYN